MSGFSGLIYESIWSHYLKLFLGHAAYAQSLVLIIFMGGMALGSYIASRISANSRSPLLIYAAVELVVGIAALLFHNVFLSLIETFYTSVLPSIGSPALGATLKWAAASLLIMPQSILLGMTFPIMSAGIIRRWPETPGASIAMLYFCNSIGAAIGVLASGFWLIALVGLPGTIFVAGMLNIVLALTVGILVWLDSETQTVAIKSDVQSGAGTDLKRLFLIAAFITGAASFIYEISWIRMLSLVLGATTHSFELMLSAFITGLAFGGLWIKRRIDRIGSPVLFSGYVQLLMGVFALLTIPVYVASFGWMEWLLQALDKTDAGYVGFSFASHSIALSVMLPTTFMAGMTLPLFTYVLIRQGAGEASIGEVYAANTIGAIVGVLFAVHIGLPMLGLKRLIVFGAMLDIALGLYLLARPIVRRTFDLSAAGVIGISALAVTIVAVDLDHELLTSGVYRTGRTDLSDDGEVVFYQDGKTATVSLMAGKSGMLVLSTNGKADASIQLNPLNAYSSTDEMTQVILGTLPIAYMSDAKHVANIGMGAGQTAHAMLAHEGIERVDTIEIEPAIVAAAAGFGDAVDRAFHDRRSDIHIEDAKTFFSLHNSIYDIIIAEPSNPWVSGVASLFSREFYSRIKSHLVNDGLFVQWIQLYEFDDELATSILKALSENFSDYIIYTTDGSNILILAKNTGALPEPNWSAIFDSGMASELARRRILSASDFQVRRIVDKRSIDPYLQRASTPSNSDYYPFVDLNAGRARYKESQSSMFSAWMAAPLPMLDLLANLEIDYSRVTDIKYLPRAYLHANALYMYRKVLGLDAAEVVAHTLSPVLLYVTHLLSGDLQSCQSGLSWRDFRFRLHDVMKNVLPNLSREMAVDVVDRIASCGRSAVDANEMDGWLALYLAVARRDGPSMAAAADNLLRAADAPAVFHEYLIDAAMLGHIAAGNNEEALGSWNRWGASLLGGGRLAPHTELILSIATARADSDAEPVAMSGQ